MSKRLSAAMPPAATSEVEMLNTWSACTVVDMIASCVYFRVEFALSRSMCYACCEELGVSRLAYNSWI